MKISLNVLRGEFIEASSSELEEEEAYRLAGWWAFAGFELERIYLRTREDDNDLRLVVARQEGRVAAVISMVRSGAKEFGWA